MARAREAAAAAVLPPAIARALAELPTETVRRPADFWIGLAPGRESGAAVTVAWTARGVVGDRVAATVDVEAVHGSTAVHAGRVEPSGLTFDAPPGTLTLTLSVRDAAGEIIDRDVRTIAIPQPSLATLALSTPVVFRARNPVELRALSGDASPPVHAGRDFQRTDRLRVRVTLYGTASQGATVSARLLGARGTALSELQVQPAGSPGLYELDLSPSSISRGDFVIAFQAEKGTERVEAMVPIRVR
jgi:hypothetical protein